jgi:hypothetical protein
MEGQQLVVMAAVGMTLQGVPCVSDLDTIAAFELTTQRIHRLCSEVPSRPDVPLCHPPSEGVADC